MQLFFSEKFLLNCLADFFWRRLQNPWEDVGVRGECVSVWERVYAHVQRNVCVWERESSYVYTGMHIIVTVVIFLSSKIWNYKMQK